MLVVAENRRREGVGKLLIDEVRNVAARKETNLIELVATRANVAAREFYRSLGFVEADVVSLEFVGSQKDPPDPEK
jgi:ribosomal protein S18 acetylase RimI-like enzyme